MDEKKFLERLLATLGVEDNDVAYIDGLAFKIDGSSASTSKLPFQTWGDFGWRNVAAAYSDMRVKYVDSIHLAVSVTTPDIETAGEIISGVLEASRSLSLSYVGGDLNQGGEVVVDVAMVGRAGRRVGRRPKPGSLLATIPQFGYTALAYRLRDLDHPTVRKGVEMLKRPLPLWPLPPEDCVVASMDSSDGLADVLWSMARGVDIHVYVLPTTEEVGRYAEEAGLDLEELVFNGGEEFLPVFAVEKDCAVGGPYVVFGEVREGAGRVLWRGEPLGWRGWSYFSSK
ncbi:MAG: AIR synthase related protein [Pyrobaculum sp.]